MLWLRCLPTNRAEKRLNRDILIRRGEFDDQPDFLEGQLTGLVSAVAEALSHDTVVGCARGKSSVRVPASVKPRAVAPHSCLTVTPLFFSAGAYCSTVAITASMNGSSASGWILMD
jgi:hypothetical protein